MSSAGCTSLFYNGFSEPNIDDYIINFMNQKLIKRKKYLGQRNVGPFKFINKKIANEKITVIKLVLWIRKSVT